MFEKHYGHLSENLRIALWVNFEHNLTSPNPEAINIHDEIW